MRIFNKKTKGFTFIEILITVAIIGILASITVIATTGIRMKSRDTKRISDANAIVNALQAYYDSNKTYPAVLIPGQPIASNGLTFLKEVPSNPVPRTDGGCSGTDYTYLKTSAGYKLTFCIGADNGDYPKGIVICKNGNCLVQDDCGETVSDVDGNIYPTVQIGTQCWMAENLKTKTRPGGTCINVNVGGYIVTAPPTCSTTIGGTIYSGFPGSRRDCVSSANTRGVESDCNLYGALYTWPGAMNLPDSCLSTNCSGSITIPHQGICPTGWHIPSDTEWFTLEDYLKDAPNVCDPNRVYPSSSQCKNAGTKLKIGGGSEFEAELAGGRDQFGTTFLHNGWGVDYWTTNAPNYIDITCPDSGGGNGYFCATARIINSAPGETGVFRWHRLKYYGFSVRCIKD